MTATSQDNHQLVKINIDMKLISRLLSWIFSPLLCPTYAVIIIFIISQLALVPTGVKISSVVATFITTCVVPAGVIMALYLMGYVSDPGLNNRTERTLPYLIAVICYVACIIFFYRANAPLWMLLFMGGASVACVVNIVVNRWWKISAHAAGVAGIVALIVRIAVDNLAIVDLFWWMTGSILVTGAVMTARVYMQRHTLWQVVAGAFNGFICVYLATMIH